MNPGPRKNTGAASPADDIDLLALIEQAIRFFTKYMWVYIAAVVLGITAGIFMYYQLASIYTSRLILHSFVLTNQEHIQIIHNWNELLKKKEYATLGATLSCPEEIFYHLKKLKADEIQRSFTGVNPHGFYVEVNVTDNAILDELQAGRPGSCMDSKIILM
jgi:hypothetical protein